MKELIEKLTMDMGLTLTITYYAGKYIVEEGDNEYSGEDLEVVLREILSKF